MVNNQKNEEQLLKEIQQLKALVENIKSIGPELQHVPSMYRDIYQRLINQNIHQRVLDEIKTRCIEHYYKNNEQVTKQDAVLFVANELKSYLETVTFGPMNLDKKFINVVGPTGVGKTTTLAKIASETVLKLKKNVAFITTDTYRIAAVEQLKLMQKS